MMNATTPQAVAALMLSAVAVACGGEGAAGPAIEDPPVAIQSPYSDVAVVPGSLRRLRVQITDAQDAGVRDVEASFAAAPGHGTIGGALSTVVTTNPLGWASADWLLPFVPGRFSVEARASHAGAALVGSPITFSGHVESFSPSVDEMLRTVEQQIDARLASSRRDLSANPIIASRIQAKIAMLETPNLGSAIVSGRFFESTTVTSMDARVLDVVSAFPRDSMRVGAQMAASVLTAALPVLETFFDLPIPAPSLRAWYGFAIGSSGGGGLLFLEDRGSFLARSHLIASPPPYDALFTHELSHSYIGHESLTQFLELLVYNILVTGSTDVAQWSYTRQYAGPSPANTGVRALLEIRELVGHDAMALAYRTIQPMRPPYGQLLTAEMKQAFVDQAPPALKPQVALKAEQIGY